MTGGIVIEVANIKDMPHVLFIDCMDADKTKSTCAIMVEKNKNSQKIEIGDIVWWQNRTAYWSPQDYKLKKGKKSGKDFDIKIPRVGYSGVTHPAREGFKSKEK